jgi:DNA polymerase-4
MTRKIIHIDLDAFYCAVEEFMNPELSGKAFAVGGNPEHRGVVASCSYAARQFGVRSAMPMARAKQLCPELVILPWRRSEYIKKSKDVMNILKRSTPLIEQLSIDEAFLDLSDKPIHLTLLATDLQDSINQETSLPCSIGAASNKLVAKIASEVGKSVVKTKTYPNAIQVVPAGREAEFLSNLPARMLWGVGPKTYETLEDLGLYTIGSIAQWPEDDLVLRFGQLGYDLSRRAKGIDHSPVTSSRETKSISQETTFNQDIDDERKLIEVLGEQCESISNNLIKANLQGTTIKLKLRWPHFETINRQTSLTYPTDEADVIYQTALNLFQENWKPGMPIRLLGVGISGFSHPSKQLSLWESADHEDQNKLQSLIDEVHKKFGNHTIRRGNKLD